MELSRWIDRQAGFQADKIALHFEGQAISYGDMALRVRRTAAMLKNQLSVGRGDRVAYLGPNRPEFLDLLFAAARLGAMFVPLNWRLAPPEHVYIVNNCAAKVLVVDPEFLDHAKAMRPQLGSDVKLVLLEQENPGWLSYEGLYGEAAADAANPHVDLKSPLLVVYTSGTTGKPKGAVLRQEALQWNAFNATHMHDLTSQDHVFTSLPLFHVGGLNIQTTPALHAGATVTMHRRFEPGAWLQAVETVKPSLTVVVPAVILALMNHPDWAKRDLSSLRLLTTGSSLVPEAYIRAFHERDIPVVQVYGSTETAPIAIYQREADSWQNLRTTGKPGLHCDMRIINRDGDDVVQGERGEILIKGPNVMYEYWGNAKATEKALRDGWFYTGDVGHTDEDGFVYVDDRVKDMIISGGENIYPAELENILADCEDLEEAAVVGRLDDRWGEVPVVVAVRRRGAKITAEDVIALFADKLAKFKHPHDVFFVEALPRNAMGKIQKYVLREKVLDL